MRSLLISILIFTNSNLLISQTILDISDLNNFCTYKEWYVDNDILKEPDISLLIIVNQQNKEQYCSTFIRGFEDNQNKIWYPYTQFNLICDDIYKYRASNPPKVIYGKNGVTYVDGVPKNKIYRDTGIVKVIINKKSESLSLHMIFYHQLFFIKWFNSHNRFLLTFFSIKHKEIIYNISRVENNCEIYYLFK
ncbi:MAG: hypothetical protein NTW49_02345 [Bacteroidia bacterium]|nr:hypothetical protein [Bacteroidia bacterium]